jgi:hypothetical protein
LIVHTAKQWDIKFYPKQASWDDIKDIDWIETNKVTWRNNPVTWEPWLWVKLHAMELIEEHTDKKILSDKQFLAAKKTLKWYRKNILFDLLSSNQYGLRNWDWKWHKNMNRVLHTVSVRRSLETVYDEDHNDWILEGFEHCAAGIRFIED